MDRYVAKTPPLSARYGTPLFIFGVVGVFVLGLVAFLIYKSKTLDQGDGTTEVAPPLAKMQASPVGQSSPVSNNGANAVAETTPLQDIPPSDAKVASNGARAGMIEGLQPAGASENPAAQVNSSVRIEFDMVSRDVLDRLTRDGDGRLEIGRYGLSIVPNFKATLASLRGDPNFKSLAAETRSLSLGQPSLVFRGGKEPKSNETIGFFIDVTPVRAADRRAEYKISIKRALPEVMPTGEVRVSSQNYEENSSVPAGAAVVFTGLLPRKQLVEGEEELYKANVLSALLEPAFQKGDDEFLVVVTPQMNEIAN